jgi:hypothetical protein
VTVQDSHAGCQPDGGNGASENFWPEHTVLWRLPYLLADMLAGVSTTGRSVSPMVTNIAVAVAVRATRRLSDP